MQILFAGALSVFNASEISHENINKRKAFRSVRFIMNRELNLRVLCLERPNYNEVPQ